MKTQGEGSPNGKLSPQVGRGPRGSRWRATRSKVKTSSTKELLL